MASYGTVDGVSALVPAAGDIDTTSTPTEGEVSTWLQQGHSRINRALSSRGYAVPVSRTANVYEELAGLNNMYAQVRLLRARGLDTVQGTEQDKARQLQSEFDKQLEDLADSDLTNAGVEIAPATTGKRRRRVRSIQMRRVDGYSGQYSGDYTGYDETSD